MAVSKKLKKSSTSPRWVLEKVVANDSFTVPRGFRIRYLGVETLTAQTTANVSIGISAGTYSTSTFTVTAVATGAGTLTLGGGVGAITVTGITTAMTTAQIAAQIATFASTTSLITSNGSTVNIISFVPSVVAASTIVLGTALGCTFSAVTYVAGAIDTSIVTATATTGNAQTVTALSVAAGKDYNPSSASKYSSYTMTTSGATAGTLYINGLPYTFTNGTLATGTTLATAIAALKIPGYTLTNPSAGVVKFTVTEEGRGYGFSKLELGTCTGVSWTTSNVDTDLIYYVNVSGPSQLSNFNLFAQLEKMN